MNYDKIKTLENYLEALEAGNDAISQVDDIKQPEPLDIAAIKTSLRNQIIAGSADKADFYGTLSTEPTVTASDLIALGLTEQAANATIAERDRIRSEALALIE